MSNYSKSFVQLFKWFLNFIHFRHDRDRENSYYEDDHLEGSTAEDNPNASRSRKVSSEFSPFGAQNLEYWSSNLLEFFGDNSRKGSSSNLQPLGNYPF